MTGERGHYEFAAGRDVAPYLRALEGFANSTGLLPEQVWDEPDRPDLHLSFGGQTGAATPLMWAHAEYIKLLRSASDGKVFDLIPAVADHYQHRRDCMTLEVWKPNRRIRTIRPGTTLRIQAPAPFRLRWSQDEWKTTQETKSLPTAIEIEYVDLPIPPISTRRSGLHSFGQASGVGRDGITRSTLSKSAFRRRLVIENGRR